MIQRIAGKEVVSLNYDPPSVTKNGSVFTSRATTKAAVYYSSYLSLLICNADDIHGIVLKNESAVFIENTEINLISRDPILTEYIKKRLTLKLVCSEENISFLFGRRLTHTITCSSFSHTLLTLKTVSSSVI